MSTRADAAFGEVRQEIAEALRLATLQSDAVSPGERMSPQEAQLRLVVVSLVSLLQAFLRETLEERADKLGASWDDLSEIEKRYVGVQILRRLTSFFDGSEKEELPEVRDVESLREAILDCASWQNNPGLLAMSPYRQKLDGFLQNNGSKVLDRVISRYSICELSFFNWLNKFHPRYRGLADSLDIIIATRNDVAHGTFLRRVTLKEVREYRVLVYRLISRIDPYIASRKDGRPIRIPSQTDIAEKAYFLWQQSGSPHGEHTKHWRKAEQQLLYG